MSEPFHPHVAPKTDRQTRETAPAAATRGMGAGPVRTRVTCTAPHATKGAPGPKGTSHQKCFSRWQEPHPHRVTAKGHGGGSGTSSLSHSFVTSQVRTVTIPTLQGKEQNVSCTCKNARPLPGPREAPSYLIGGAVRTPQHPVPLTLVPNPVAIILVTVPEGQTQRLLSGGGEPGGGADSDQPLRPGSARTTGLRQK